MAQLCWTPQQRRAIDARNPVVLVSAAAGSGKTAVLSERAVTRMLDDGSPIEADRLLVVTFTRAAAREMKQRLLQKLSERIEREPENQAARRQRVLADRAVIGTIHALCFDLLRQNFQRLGLPAAFRIGDGQELSAMRAEAVGAALEAAYADPEDGDFLELAELFSRRTGDKSLSDAVLSVLDFARAHPFYRDWLDEKLELYAGFSSPADSVWGRIILNDSLEAVAQAAARTSDALKIIEAQPELAPYSAAFLSDLAALERLGPLLERNNWDGAAAFLRDFVFAPLSAAKKAPEPERERIKRLRGRTRDLVTRLKTELFSATEAEFCEDIADLLPKIRRLFLLVKDVDDRLLTQKIELGVLDFSDLEQFSAQLLMEKRGGGYHPTAFAAECAARFDEVMVDEYQDVNAVQDMILTALSQGGSLFLVGDVKQSIYRFRQAQPELFLQRAALYRRFDDPARPALVTLGGNFRSRPEITRTVNRVFAALMSPSIGELTYDDTQKLEAAGTFLPAHDCGVQLHLLDCSGEPDANAAADAEARWTAQQIARLLREGYPVQEKGALRPVRPRDICILLRSPKGRADLYRRALAAQGVEARAEMDGGFLNTPEILAMQNLLRAVDNPTRDIELIGAMQSEMFGFTDDDLAKIRLASPEGGFYAALLKAASTDGRCGAFLMQLDRFRRRSADMSAAQLICEIYRETGFDLICRAKKDGEQRFLNLALLAQYAEDYHQNGYRGLGAFLRILDGMAERGEDLAPAFAGEGADAVTVTSIHRSKGLEWPVVFLCDCARQHSFYRSDLIAPVILHTELGLACVRRDKTLKKQFATPPLWAARLESERALLSEELRVLYVAMTRAAQRLVVTASSKDPWEWLSRYGERQINLSPAQVREGSCFADWLLMAMAQSADLSALAQGGGCCEGFSLIAGEKPAFGQAGPQRAPTPAEPDAALLDALVKRAAFVYPFEEAARIPAKLSVSELTHAEGGRQRFLNRPAFLSGEKAIGAERGSAVHAFMQYCDFSAARADAAGELARLRAQGILTPRQADAVDLAQVAAFFRSDLAARIFSAKRVLREFRFMAPAGACVRARRLCAQNGESPMLQGIADCVLLEEESAVLIDYKTDRVASPQPLFERYRAQLLLYREMLAAVLGVPVTECLLYSFSLGRTISVDSALPAAICQNGC